MKFHQLLTIFTITLLSVSSVQALQTPDKANNHVYLGSAASPFYVDFSLGNFDEGYQKSVLEFLNGHESAINTTLRDFIVTVQYTDLENVQHIKLYPMEVYESGWELPIQDAFEISLVALQASTGEWLVDFEERMALDPPGAISKAAPNYSFPWKGGSTWKKSQGFHSSSLGYSIDFPPSGSAPTDVFSIEAGTLTPYCYIAGDSYQANVIVTHTNGDVSGYIHLDKSTVPTLGFNKEIPKGYHLGKVYNGTAMTAPNCSSFSNLQFSTPCGCGTEKHIHFEANNLITIQGYSLTSISNAAVNTLYTSNNSGSVPPITSIQAASGNLTEYISVTFGDTLGAEGYEIWRNTINSLANAVKIGSDTDGSPYNDASAIYGTTYYYWVRACNYYGCGPYSYARSGYRQAPIAPSDLTLSNSSIYENESIGAFVGSFTTSDPNISETNFIYSLAAGSGGADNAAFSISDNYLITKTLFNYSIKNQYSIRVRTTDSSGLWLEKVFSISILEANLAPQDIDLSNLSVADGSPANTLIGYFSTTDLNVSDIFTYSLAYGYYGGADNSSFKIVDNELRILSGVEYQTQDQYSIRVRSTDAQGLFIEENFIIEVKPRVVIFQDVSLDHWASSFIETLYQNGITGGCSTNPLQYCPENTVTRGQMAVFLEKGIHTSSFVPPNVPSSFSDTPGHWAATWIEALKNDGITSGCANGFYCPESLVTRAQMAVFLLKSKHGSNYSPPVASGIFSDVPLNYWAASWIEQLASEDITSGCSSGAYCPDQSVTRAQMAVFLVKTFNLP